MSKTIDVRPGDTWTLVDDGGMFQYRNKQWRGIYADTREDEMYWRGPQDRLACEVDIPSDHAIGMLKSWGYTLTPAAKPEANGNCQQESKPETLTQAKPADVPLVDAVWVEIAWNVGATSIYLYASLEAAQRGIEYASRDGRTARIVRLRTVDEEARADAKDNFKHVHDRINVLLHRIDALESRISAEKDADNILPPVDAAWAAQIESKIAALESCLAAVTESAAYARQIADNVSDRVDELAERVKHLESRLAAVGVEYKESKDE